MLVMAGGRERTIDEYAVLLDRARLDLTGTVPTASGYLPHRGLGRVTAMVEFTLDGRTVAAPEGELLVHAAARHGTFIPTLCHDEKLDPYGGCRMCVVDVEGAPRPLPACATRLTEGMVVSTNGPITGFQRTLTEMLLSEHLNASPGGRPNELLDLADELGATLPSCSRTRSACPTTTATSSWATTRTPASSATAASATRRRSCSARRSRSRGGAARRGSSPPGSGPGSTPSASSAAAACRCARPARSTRSSWRARASRSAQLEQVRTTCTYCGVGCQIDLNLDPQTKHVVKVTSKSEYLPNEGNLCVKGRFSFNFVHHPDRLTQPLVRGEDGELHPTTWEHALETAATGIRR